MVNSGVYDTMLFVIPSSDPQVHEEADRNLHDFKIGKWLDQYFFSCIYTYLVDDSETQQNLLV